MRRVITSVCLWLMMASAAHAQDTTNHFTIEGAIAKSVTIDWDLLKKYQPVALDSMPVYNHQMKRKHTLKNIKGVLLKDLFSVVEWTEKSPKNLSEIYITCAGIDGYKVVFSWNEIFNSAIGDKAMIVTEKDGRSGTMQEDKIVLISPADIATGRRYVKGLNKIIIEQVR